MVTFAIDTFEAVRAWFLFGSFKSRRISLEIYFTTPCYVFIVFNLVQSVAFLVFRSVDIICKCRMFPLLAIFALRDSRVHVGIVATTSHKTNSVTKVNSIKNISWESQENLTRSL